MADDKLKLGDYLRSINTKDRLISRDEFDNGYPPFVVNRTLSYFVDTCFQAATMNRLGDFPPYVQYLYFYHSVPKGRRFSPWHKPEEHKYLQLVKEYYGFSNQKAMDALKILTEDDLKKIEKELYKGGKDG